MKRGTIFLKSLVIVLCLGLILSNPCLAAYTSQSGQDTVAVLFLIDESGGVSGECSGVSDKQVYAVDVNKKRRYKIVRFFAALVGSIYDPEYGREDRRNLPNNIQVGVAQFADQYIMTYGFTPASKIFRSEFPVEEPPSNLDKCQTNYNLALRESAKTLKATGADHQVLVLVTDGSFRGTENDWIATKEKHDEIRNETEDTLKEIINDSTIKTYVFVLGMNECRSSNDCGLNDDEYQMRRGDLSSWEAWDNDDRADLINLLDTEYIISETALMKLTETKSLQDWLNGQVVSPNEYEGIPFPALLPKLRVNVISIESFNDKDCFDLLKPPLDNPGETNPDEQDRAANVIPSRPRYGAGQRDQGNYWWQYDVSKSNLPSPKICCEQRWHVKLPDGEGAYIWTDALWWPDEVRANLLKSVSVPKQVLIREGQGTLDVQVSMDLPKQLIGNSCYELVFELREETGINLETVRQPLKADAQINSFDLSSLGCPSREVEVNVAIQHLDSSNSIADGDKKSVYIYFRPEIIFDGIQVTKPGISTSGIACSAPSTPQLGEVQVDIPIRYATKDCNPGFEPTFVLTRTFIPSDTIKDCRSTGYELDPSAQISGYVTTYSFGIPYGASINDPADPGDWECGYRTVIVQGEGMNETFDLASSSTESSSVDISLPVTVLIILVAFTGKLGKQIRAKDQQA